MTRSLVAMVSLLMSSVAHASLSGQHLSGHEAKLFRQALQELGSHERVSGAKHVLALSHLDCRVDKFQRLQSYRCKTPEFHGEKARRVVQLLVEAHVPAVSGWGVQAWELRELRCETKGRKTSCQFQG